MVGTEVIWVSNRGYLVEIRWGLTVLGDEVEAGLAEPGDLDIETVYAVVETLGP